MAKTIQLATLNAIQLEPAVLTAEAIYHLRSEPFNRRIPPEIDMAMQFLRRAESQEFDGLELDFRTPYGIFPVFNEKK